VLINVVLGASLKTAAQVATAACRNITFETGAQFRTDIGRKGYKL
jgi:phosphoribosylamine-glycine ligase